MKLKSVLNPVYVYKKRDLIKPTLKVKHTLYSRLIHQWLKAHNILLTANDRRVAALKNIHRGRRCFIVGNGPSLLIGDLDKLKGEIAFASNKIYLAFDETQWRPTYYSVIDALVAENNRSTINNLDLCKIFHEHVRSFIGHAKDIVWLSGFSGSNSDRADEDGFSLDVLKGVYAGASVIYPQIQLAFYMGIREIYLIGLDFSFDVPKSTGRISASGEVVESQGEVNHFHPEYRKPGETWTMPLLDVQYKAFVNAKRAVESHGGGIYNASRKTALDVFPRVDFDSIVSVP